MRREGKRAMARAAKLYVSELIGKQDTPDWLYETFGADVDAADERDFMVAIQQIAERLARDAGS
jgi:hypothetical protein